MSYDPMLIINRLSLESSRREIEDYENKVSNLDSKEIQAAWQEVIDALNTEERYVIKFPKMELIIIQPELTSHNARVRKVLNDLKIEFRESY